MTLSITVPVNSTATVTIPTVHPHGVTESGVAAQNATGVLSANASTGALVLVAGSGQYTFVAP